MTNRDFFAAVAGLDNIDADLVTFANDAIAKLDAKNANRKPSKESLEAQNRRLDVLEYFSDASIVADRDTVADALGITPGQATAALTHWVKGGKLQKEVIKSGKATKTFYSFFISE